MLNQGASDADPLLLPARELVTAPIFEALETHPFEESESLLDVVRVEAPANAPPEPGPAERSAQDVLHDGQAPDERVLLEDHTHSQTCLTELAEG